MSRVGMWNIISGAPRRIAASTLEFEKDLEDWIEDDPSLLQSDLTIVGRQAHTPAGPLDLIAIDAQGRWTVIEIKRGKVRRDTVAQALDYAACVASMEWSELSARAEECLRGRADEQLEDSLRLLSLQATSEARDIAIIVVGSGKDQGLERIVDFLSRAERPRGEGMKNYGKKGEYHNEQNESLSRDSLTADIGGMHRAGRHTASVATAGDRRRESRLGTGEASGGSDNRVQNPVGGRH